MTRSDCSNVMAALLRVIRNGGTLTDDERAHLQTCERCSVLVSEAADVEASLADDDLRGGEIDADAVAREAKRVARGRTIVRVLVAFLVLFAILCGVLVAVPQGLGRSDVIAAIFGGIIIATLFAVPVIAFMSLARGKDSRRPRLYKRLGPGRWISGVCLGLAERTGWTAGTIRLIFALLVLVIHGGAITLYLFLALTLPVHPADRQYLLRFRIARWFRSRRDDHMIRA